MHCATFKSEARCGALHRPRCAVGFCLVLVEEEERVQVVAQCAHSKDHERSVAVAVRPLHGDLFRCVIEHLPFGLGDWRVRVCAMGGVEPYLGEWHREGVEVHVV